MQEGHFFFLSKVSPQNNGNIFTPMIPFVPPTRPE
jgi:hypothetical protein